MLAALSCLLSVITLAKGKKKPVNIEGTVIVLGSLKETGFLAFGLPVWMLLFRSGQTMFNHMKRVSDLEP